jgi:signal peptidase I
MAELDGLPVEGESLEVEMSAPSFPDAELARDVSLPTETSDTSGPSSFVLDLLGLAAKAIVVAVVIKLLLVQVFWIPSESMYDTLEVGDRVAVNKLAYRFGNVGRGNVVVFDLEPRADESLPSTAVRTVAEAIGLRTPQSDLIKRVIALPGESIEVRDNTVFIDGVALVEPYAIWDGQNPTFGPEVIPDGTVFVMGDNRSHSRDSRIFGPVPQDRIIGRAFVVLWPVANWSGL